MNQSNPLVSVIVPVYNTEKYLADCLDSIKNQTYDNLEIICINDGSTDNSATILQSYANTDPRIKIITQKNQGLSAARNAGIKKSTGNFVTFVDSDDQIEPQMISRMINAVNKNSSDIVACSFKELYPSGKIVHFNRHNYPQKSFTVTEALKAMLKEEGFMVSATMKLFPKSYFKNVKFPLGLLHEDVGTTYKLIMQAYKITFIPHEDYIYIHHKNSIINKSFDDRKFDLITLTDQMCNDIDQQFPDLKNVTRERRMRARFSILRQIPTSHPQTKNLLNYLRTNQIYITKNPEATKADKIALRLALINPRLLKLAYKLFK